jgi:DNA invertase Pin-like site-specific DNA recombinase
MERMKYGYARVSKDEQNPALQMDALKKAGCDRAGVQLTQCLPTFQTRTF